MKDGEDRVVRTTSRRLPLTCGRFSGFITKAPIGTVRWRLSIFPCDKPHGSMQEASKLWSAQDVLRCAVPDALPGFSSGQARLSCLFLNHSFRQIVRLVRVLLRSLPLFDGSGLFIGEIAIFGVDRAWKMPYFCKKFSTYMIREETIPKTQLPATKEPTKEMAVRSDGEMQ